MKRTIDIDGEAAEEAAAVLGTKTLAATVNAALREVVRTERRMELARQIRAGTLSVPSAEELAALRAPKLPVGALEGFAPDDR